MVRQALAYSLPAAVSLVGAVALAGSSDIGDIVQAQCNGLPYVVYQPLGLLLLALSLLAGVRRLPSRLAEGEDETAVHLHLHQRRGARALFHASDYVHLLLVSALIATTYLAGPCGPGPDGLHWLALKTLVVAILLIWLRGGWLAHRGRWLREGGWAALTLLAAVNALLTGVVLVWTQ